MRRLAGPLVIVAFAATACGPGASPPPDGVVVAAGADRAPVAPATGGHTATSAPTGASGSTDPFADLPEGRSLIGSVVADRVVARSSPSRSARPLGTFHPRSQFGGPQVFLLLDSVVGHDGRRWFRALLPVRPNGTTGFLPARALGVEWTDHHLVVDRSRFRLELWEGADLVATYPVGLGTGATPTPVGRFYLASLLEPPTPDSVYGTFAYGLSGYSDVLTDWEGGGVIGLHGTNDPSSVGRRSSHGCIRMRNRDIERLVEILPLGTPILIR